MKGVAKRSNRYKHKEMRIQKSSASRKTKKSLRFEHQRKKMKEKIQLKIFAQ